MVRLYEGVPQPDHAAICQCLMTLDDSDEVAAILARLLGWVPGLAGSLFVWVLRLAGSVLGWVPRLGGRRP